MSLKYFNLNIAIMEENKNKGDNNNLIIGGVVSVIIFVIYLIYSSYETDRMMDRIENDTEKIMRDTERQMDDIMRDYNY